MWVCPGKQSEMEQKKTLCLCMRVRARRREDLRRLITPKRFGPCLSDSALLQSKADNSQEAKQEAERGRDDGRDRKGGGGE